MSVSQASPVTITLPDGSKREFPGPVTGAELASGIGAGLARAALAVKVDDTLLDLSIPITSDATVAIITSTSPEAVALLRHSTAHLMAQAIKRMRPDAMLEDGPPTEEGFWYDIKTEPAFTPEDFPAIEAEMKKIAKEALPVRRREMNRADAIALFTERKEKYKLEILERIPEGATISVYDQGEFTDLCRGPHVPHTGALKSFKLMAVSGAYWKGDAKNDQLCRMKGTAFAKQEELDAHLKVLEEAKARDHRRVGKEMGLFMHHEWAPGETFWLPKGRVMYRVLGNMMSDLYTVEGYDEVFTPMLFKSELFKTSGHWEHYRENMFLVPGREAEVLDNEGITGCVASLTNDAKSREADWKAVEGPLASASSEGDKLSSLLKNKHIADRHPHIFERSEGEFVHLKESEGETYALKPMNCPSHMLIFRNEKRSYRDLPMRIADQGVLHRNEPSGALSGLTRVRQFCQDDSHLFLSSEMIEEEITNLIALAKRVYKPFGVEYSKVFLSTRPAKYMGAKAHWDAAENALEAAIKNNNMEFIINEGDGAFYGPKIDFQVKDGLGREWQTTTIQLDYQLPQKFELSYVDRDNTEKTPIVVHRALFGSFERFLGIMIEHFAGWFPVWLAPEQVRVLTISEKSEAYGREVLTLLKAAGVRATLDLGAEKIGAKVRLARLARVPYTLVVGEEEGRNRAVAVRTREKDEGAVSLESFLNRISVEKAIQF